MIIDKGHFRAEVDTQDLDDVPVKVSMCTTLETSEAMLQMDETQLMEEFSSLRLMINDYINYLYQLREEELAYAV